MSTLLSKRLQGLVGSQVIVVMSDHRAFRGQLIEFDDQTLVLHDVVEGSPTSAAGWQETTVSAAVKETLVTWRGTFTQESSKQSEIVRLKDAMIQIAHVLRVWHWDPKNIAKPEHVILEDRPSASAKPAGAKPAPRESGRGGF
ncbi:MAG TPA: LSM domain-containing protein [Candidatus Thermoplasmatota archaeon]|nr:LSM domain-containing protein [Candidatus Thermoplasmatota archaeon]